MDVKANAQSLINVSRYRLCYGCAHKETREYMEDLKKQIRSVEPEIADVMVPNCVYRGGCPEFSECGFWRVFIKRNNNVDMSNIKERYRVYNKEFYDKENE